MVVKRREVEIGDADLARHQLVQQRLEEVVEDVALAAVQVDLAVDGVEDGNDFELLVEDRRKRDKDLLDPGKG